VVAGRSRASGVLSRATGGGSGGAGCGAARVANRVESHFLFIEAIDLTAKGVVQGADDLDAVLATGETGHEVGVLALGSYIPVHRGVALTSLTSRDQTTPYILGSAGLGGDIEACLFGFPFRLGPKMMLRLLSVAVKRIVAGEVCRKVNDIRKHG
jgi:hypothetical protein